MDALPEDVGLLMLRGLGRYIRDTPPSELSPSVRRFKGFRESALTRHRDTILGLLDDDASRALILQWLDDEKPKLPADVASALRLAAARTKGWDAELAGMSTAGDEAVDDDDTVARLEAALEREKEKHTRLRESHRKERTESQSALADERARRTRLEQQVGELEEELSAAQAEIGELRDRLDAERARSDRELRRARSEVEKARAAERTLADELRSREAEIGSPREERAERDERKSVRKTPVRRKPRTGTRVPLKVPKGFLADDPQVLSGWLERDDVHLIVDGYNVTKSETGYSELSLENQRERLVTELSALVARRKIDSVIVFDGASVMRPRSGKKVVRTIFTAEEEIADDVIVELVESLPPEPVVVVTNDRELQERVAALGATVARSGQLLELLR